MWAKVQIFLMFERVVHVINSLPLNAETVISVICRLYSFKQDGKRVINFE
jgi:hypothetical protein